MEWTPVYDSMWIRNKFNLNQILTPSKKGLETELISRSWISNYVCREAQWFKRIRQKNKSKKATFWIKVEDNYFCRKIDVFQRNA